MRVTRILFLGGLFLAAGCVPRSEPPPPPQAEREPAPRPMPPRPAPPAPDWRDLPLTGGDWYYSSQGGTSQALFGPPNSEALFIVRCEPSRQVTLSKAGRPTSPALTIRTTTDARTFPATVRVEPLSYASTTLSANDRFLDAIVFSRGRFVVEMPGTPRLVLPTWPAPARVVEDCRG